MIYRRIDPGTKAGLFRTAPNIIFGGWATVRRMTNQKTVQVLLTSGQRPVVECTAEQWEATWRAWDAELDVVVTLGRHHLPVAAIVLIPCPEWIVAWSRRRRRWVGGASQ